MADARLKRSWRLDPQSAGALARGEHGNPFAVLGPHDTSDGCIIRAYPPGATKVEALRRSDGALLSTLEQGAETGCSKILFMNGRPIDCEFLGQMPSRRPRTRILSACCSATSTFICSMKAGISICRIAWAPRT